MVQPWGVATSMYDNLSVATSVRNHLSVVTSIFICGRASGKKGDHQLFMTCIKVTRQGGVLFATSEAALKV